MTRPCRNDRALPQLRYDSVYWNSRLEAEHGRLVGLLRDNDVLVDMMAGIGPFAVPAAKRGIRVFANDLNPESHKWLAHNLKLNKVERKARASCLDARAFMRALCAPRPTEPDGASELLAARREAGGGRVHVAMNLPASALEFLDTFVGLFRKGAWEGELPTVHCYCFSKAKDGAAVADVRERAAAVLGASLEGRSDVHVVRDVAPSKLMLCVSFAVPDEVGWAHETVDGGAAPAAERERARDDGAVLKRARIEAATPAGTSGSPPDEGL